MTSRDRLCWGIRIIAIVLYINGIVAIFQADWIALWASWGSAIIFTIAIIRGETIK